MNEEKIINNYYQSNIKTSRSEDSVYAMRYASQQMLINKLEHNWNELKKWLIEQEQRAWDEVSTTFGYVLDKLEELEGDSNE